MDMEGERLATIVIRQRQPIVELLKVGRDRLAEAADVLRYLADVERDVDRASELREHAGRVVDVMRRYAPAGVRPTKRGRKSSAVVSGRDRAMPAGDR